MRRGKLAADHSHHAPGGKPEKQQQNPGVGGEKAQEEAAQVQAQEVLEQHQAQRAISALAHGIAQDHARVPGIELLVNFEPQPDGDPGDQREPQNQDLALGGQIEDVWKM